MVNSIDTATVCPICLRPSPGGAHPSCAKDLYGTTEIPRLDVTLGDVEPLAKETVNKRFAVTGVQRKLSLTHTDGERDSRLTIVGAMGGTHILKPPAPAYPGMPELEHWSMVLAKECGIVTAVSGLIEMASGEMAFITKRFDRRKNIRIQVEDFCQLSSQPTADKYKSSVERAGNIIHRYSTLPGDDVLKFFEIVVFSFLIGNSDMHLKNWSLVIQDNSVRLAPAYDLLPTRMLSGDPEESALPINGKKNRLTRKDFVTLGSYLKIPPRVVERTLGRLPALLAGVVVGLKSPWVPTEQAREFENGVLAKMEGVSR